MVDNLGGEDPSLAGHGIIISNFFQPDDPRRGESVYRNRIINNTVQRNYRAGISTVSNVQGAIIGNIAEANGLPTRFTSNGIGISRGDQAILATDSVVRDNTVIGNGQGGIFLDRGVQGNTIGRNEVSGSLFGIGAGFGTRDNLIQMNTALGNVFDLADQGDGGGSTTCPNIWRDNVYVTAIPPCIFEENPPVSGASASSSDSFAVSLPEPFVVLVKQELPSRPAPAP